jgi:hypothetical protein
VVWWNEIVWCISFHIVFGIFLMVWNLLMVWYGGMVE